MLVKIVLFSVIICEIYAALALAPQQPKPKQFKNVEGCYIRELDSVIPFGESKPSKSRCMEYRCAPEYVTFVTCGAVAAEPPLKVVEDKTKPYPGCCPRISA